MVSRQHHLQSFDLSLDCYPNISYEHVKTTNYYRPGRPYRLFYRGGSSKVTFSFGLSGIRNATHICLKLSHCRTTANGVVNITANGATLCQSVMAPRDNFGTESWTFGADNFHQEGNALTIELAPGSPGVYWLSDVDIYVVHIDQDEKINKTARDTFVYMKKLSDGRKKIIKHLRQVADELDKLHATINKVKATGQGEQIGGYLLCIGGGVLEAISAGTATPVVAAMEASGAALIVGGAAGELGADFWEQVKNKAAVKEINKDFEDDKQNCLKFKSLVDAIQTDVEANKDRYVKEFPELKDVTVQELIMARLMMSATNYARINFGSMFEEPGLKSINSVLRFLEQDCLELCLKFLGKAVEVVGLVWTVADLMKTVADMKKGSPSEMATTIRGAADNLEINLEAIQNFRQDTLNSILTNMNTQLQSSNILSVATSIQFLPPFDQIKSRAGLLNMEWLNHWNNYENQLTSTFRLATLLNLIYQELEKVIRDNVRLNIDLVVVAHGSIGAPTAAEHLPLPGMVQARIIPARLLFATSNLESVTFYQPWGVLIDARAIFYILKGRIRPEITRFEGVGHASTIPNSLDRFNILEEGQVSNVMIPNVWSNAILDNEQPFQVLQQYIGVGGTERPYIWWRSGSVPTFIITALASMAAALLSRTGARITLRIHHGQCLNWPSTTDTPPAELCDLPQYYNAVAETYRQPYNMTVE